MATVGPVLTTTSQANDLYRFVSNPDRRTSADRRTSSADRRTAAAAAAAAAASQGLVNRPPLPFRALDPVVESGSVREEEETGSRKRPDDHRQHLSSALKRIRAKAKRRVTGGGGQHSEDDPQQQQQPKAKTGSSTAAASVDQVPTTSTSSPSSSSSSAGRACVSCVLVGCDCTSADLWLPNVDRSDNCLRKNYFEEDRKSTNPGFRRGMIKRSVSAVGELGGGHSLLHSTMKPLRISGQRLSEWKDPIRIETEMRNDVITKRLSLVERRSKASPGKIVVDSEGTPESALRDCLNVLGGSPYGARDSPVPSDKSPLIELDRSPFAAAKNSFDNVAATANDNRSPGQRNPPSGGLAAPGAAAADPAQLRYPANRVESGPAAKQPTTPRATAEAKKKRWFPGLRVKIPEDEDNVGIGPKINLKKLSAADERKIDEVLELAGTFGRLGGSDLFPSTPRTPGTLSKGSKESLASSSDSPSSHFRFNFFKGRKDEKMTFAEELASHLTDPSSLLTPDALDAYEKLVSKGSSKTADSGKSILHAKQSTRQAHRSSHRIKLLQRRITQRNSLSELEKDTIQEESLQTRSAKTDAGRPMTQKPASESSFFVWFEKSPLNSTRSEHNVRPKSLHSFDQDSFKNNPFPLSMPSQSPGVEVPPRGGREKKQESTRRLPPPPPSHVEAEPPDQPPPIPPRTPCRQSTMSSAGQARFHKNHYRGASKDKLRSYSEEGNALQSMKLSLCDVPRRKARSTEDSDDEGDLISLEPQSRACNRMNSLHDSNDSVFDHMPRSPHGSLPLVRELNFRSSREAKGFGPHRSMSVKNVKVKAKELGISDKNDPFWKNVAVDLSESHSESDLLREALAPIPGRYETSDCVSYEDLLEFTLDGLQQNNRNDNADSTVCDEIRLMRKMFSNDVTVDDCMDALDETSWNVHYAVKLIKLKQLLGTGLGTQDQCKDALMASKWNVDEAAAQLLTNN